MRTMNFVRFFRKYGPVDVAYSDPSGGEYEKSEMFSNGYHVRQKEALPGGFVKRLNRLFRVRNIPLPIRPVDRQSERLLLSAIAKEDYDYIFVRYAANCSVLFNLPEKYKKRTIIDFDDILSDSLYRSKFGSVRGLHKRAFAKLNHGFLINYERKCLGVGAVLFCSDKDREKFTAHTSKANLQVVPNAYVNRSFEGFDFGNGFDRGNVLLFVGSLGYGPNVRGLKWFIETILPSFRECYSDGKLVVVGRTPSDETRQLCDETRGVELYADVPDIKKYYRECRAVVVPLLTGGGTRIKILEAAMAGRPVISTPMGADGLDLRNGEELLLFSHYSDFLCQYAKLLDKEYYHSVVKKGCGAVKEKYSISGFYGAMEEVIRYVNNSVTPLTYEAGTGLASLPSGSEGTKLDSTGGKPGIDAAQTKCNLCGQLRSKEVFVKKNYRLVQCSSCGLSYVSNLPTEEEIRKMYSFDSNYHKALNANRGRYKKHFEVARRHLEVIGKYRAKGRLLDIGCSAGFFLKLARDEGWDTYGLEISSDTAQLARNMYALNVTTGCLTNKSFQKNCFDLVTLWDVIEHLRDPLGGLLNINRILKDNGILVLSTPNIDGLFPKMSYKIARLINYWPHPEPPYHLFQFSRITIRKMLERTGFNVLEISDERIPLSYSFGNIKTHIRYPQRLLYSGFFVPLAVLGPLVHRGDSLIVIASKSPDLLHDSGFEKKPHVGINLNSSSPEKGEMITTISREAEGLHRHATECPGK